MFARRGVDGRYMALVARVDLRERRADQPLRAAWVRTVEEKSPEALLALPLILGGCAMKGQGRIRTCGTQSLVATSPLPERCPTGPVRKSTLGDA